MLKENLINNGSVLFRSSTIETNFFQAQNIPDTHLQF